MLGEKTQKPNLPPNHKQIIESFTKKKKNKQQKPSSYCITIAFSIQIKKPSQTQTNK